MTDLVNRVALTAANAIAWPYQDDPKSNIDDEDDLQRVLEAAAPHIIGPVLAALHERMVKLNTELVAGGDNDAFPDSWRLHLRSVAKGVRDCIGCVDETIRGLS